VVCLVLIFKFVALILNSSRPFIASTAIASLIFLRFERALHFREEGSIILLSSKSWLQTWAQTLDLVVQSWYSKRSSITDPLMFDGQRLEIVTCDWTNAEISLNFFIPNVGSNLVKWLFYIQKRHYLTWPEVNELGAPRMKGQFLTLGSMLDFQFK